ncbi:MAG: FlgD immunoglobulin-like domain containing protein [Candidatus Krumholzibacteriia bacterium]
MRSNPTCRRGPRAALCLALAALVLLPSLALAGDCLTPQLPRPAGDPAAIRADLAARGLWHRNGGPALSPPPDPQVGDTWLWYVWNLGGFPTATLKPATVRGLGEHCYVVVDDDEWNVTMTQADVDRIVENFDLSSVGQFSDQGIWDLDTAHFGDPPNPLDGLDRIFLFYYRFNISADGFFWVYDQFPDGSQPFASNECDVVYMATDTGQPASDYMLAVAAHEFTHLIMFASDSNEALWMEEGLGELAMWLFGRPDTISSFNSNPDNSLINWGSAWADYIQTYLWTLYCYERFGGQPFIRALCFEPADGLAGYQATIDAFGFRTPTADVFGDWSVANYIDDVSVPDGRYGYVGTDLPAFNPWRTHATYPVSSSGSVQAYATDYVRLRDLASSPTVTFDGSDAAAWRVSLIALADGLPTLVQPLALDPAGAGTLDFAAAAGYDEVIISVANVSTTSTGIYTYQVDQGVTGSPLPAAAATVAASPNPFNPRTELSFAVPAAGPVRLRIHTPDGRLVSTLVDGTLPAGEHRAPWLGRDDAGREVPSGTYLVQLVTAAGASTAKLMLVR